MCFQFIQFWVGMGRYGSCGLSRLIIFNTVNLSMNLLKMRFNLASIMMGIDYILVKNMPGSK